MKTSFHLSISAAVFCLILAGCDGSDLFSSAPGHYDGYLAYKAEGKIKQVMVSVEVVKDAKDKKMMHVAAKSTQDAAVRWNFDIKAKSSKELKLTPPAPLSDVRELKKSSAECFVTKSNENNPDSRLCYDGRELAIEASLVNAGLALTLVVNRLDPTRIPVLEKPDKYTIAKILDRAMNRNFDTRIEFEHVVQAKLTALSAALSLLPHFTINTVIGVAMSGWSALYREVGNLLPFLFPNRWFQAKEAALQSRAEQDTLLLMKADSANIAEGIAFGISRDLKLLERFEANVLSTTSIRDEILAKEKLGLLQAGSSDDVTAIINDLETALSALRWTLKEEYAALAQAAGFFNPQAIEALDLTDAGEPELVDDFDQKAITDAALIRSIELNQMDTLIDAARWNKWERMFTWLDPSGNPEGSFGATIYPFISTNHSQLRELQKKREKLEAMITEKVWDAIGQAKQSLDAYRLAENGALIDDRRVSRISANMRLGINYSLADLVGALQAQVKDDVARMNARYTYYVQTSRLRRLLFVGPYTKLSLNQNPELRP